MNNNFEPNDRRSWYFGRISRQDATDLLMEEKDNGTFLVRDSSSIPGDFVLCVKEDCKVCHYIINKVEEDDVTKYKIGDRVFSDLPSLLGFYKMHYLDTTPLTRPASRRVIKVIAKHDFEGHDPEDLPFRKGEILTVISKDEEQWWAAKNSMGRIGAIPVPYVKPYEESQTENNMSSSQQPPNAQEVNSANPPQENHSSNSSNQPQRKNEWNKPQYARVKQARVPNAYDDTALKLQVGDIIRVTKTNMSGQWEGELILPGGQTGRKGHFPFTHVDFPIEYEPGENQSQADADDTINGLNMGLVGLTIKTT